MMYYQQILLLTASELWLPAKLRILRFYDYPLKPTPSQILEYQSCKNMSTELNKSKFAT